MLIQGSRPTMAIAAFGVLVACCTLGGCSTIERTEEIQLSEAPAAVRQTLEREARGGKVMKLEKETQGDEVEYEAEVINAEGKWLEIEIAPDGTITESKEKKRGS